MAGNKKKKGRGPTPPKQRKLYTPDATGVPIIGAPSYTPGSVVVSYLSPGSVSSAFHESLLNTYAFDLIQGGKHLWNGGGKIGVHSGANITRARNSVVTKFLDQTDSEWLWMVDSDMRWQPEALEQLLAVADKDERPFIGGLCFGQKAPAEDPSLPMAPFPTLFFVDGEGGTYMSWEYPEDSLYEVDATGAAFVLVHRTVLEKIRAKYKDQAPFVWFAEELFNGKHFSEDIVFCLRAKSVGVPVFVHTGIKVGHDKPRILDEAEYQSWYEDAKDGMETQKFTPEEWWAHKTDMAKDVAENEHTD